MYKNCGYCKHFNSVHNICRWELGKANGKLRVVFPYEKACKHFKNKEDSV